MPLILGVAIIGVVASAWNTSNKLTKLNENNETINKLKKKLKD
tara:strand:- start:35866 stop:35994 length:129 start_codon:yes stop_codon:yes gene_type:complete